MSGAQRGMPWGPSPQMPEPGCLVLLTLVLRKMEVMNLDIISANINHLPKCNLFSSWLTFSLCGSFLHSDYEASLPVTGTREHHTIVVWRLVSRSLMTGLLPCHEKLDIDTLRGWPGKPMFLVEVSQMRPVFENYF